MLIGDDAWTMLDDAVYGFAALCQMLGRSTCETAAAGQCAQWCQRKLLCFKTSPCSSGNFAYVTSHWHPKLSTNALYASAGVAFEFVHR
jgi:hypothetical protein